jgi:NAD(P)-dependent dehydrogenase (short-subunit alcohol dehydrogenase family)
MDAARQGPAPALVTGAARRIGRVIALRLAREGHDVVIHCNESRGEAEAVLREVASLGRRGVIVAADLADAEACVGLMRDARAAIGPIGLLVNNASRFAPDEAQSFTTQGFDAHLSVNLRAPLILAREMAAALPAGAGGAVVNILDQRVAKPTPHFFSYGLSKAALFDATHILAQALAPRIRVNAVAPGPTLSNARQRPEDFAKQGAGSALQRTVAPEEIADAVAYLAQARSVTGQTLFVDAGQRLSWRTPDVDGVRE